MNKLLTIILLLLVLMFIQACTRSIVEVGEAKIIYEPVMTASKEIE
jgi:hypothetical protein